MKKTIKSLFVGIILLSIVLNLNTAGITFAISNSGNTKNFAESVEVWKNFRKNDFPFHIQTVAFDEKTGTLIVSEPPPHVTLDNFKKINPAALSQTVISEEHPIGYDGWVKDLIVQLPEMDKGARQNLFDQINSYLFHTSYKADILSLPVKTASFDKTALNVTVTNSDLQDWLIDKNEVFQSILTGDQIQFNNIISQKKSGVYLSNEPSLVVWAIDRKKPLNDYLAEARQFSLDSDLIVGAISNADMLAIVGRERILPTDVFPPLRIESILRLAATTNTNLAQSYERKYVFAGKFNETDDWAPVYLSDDLIDTEYGSLLNITDQILKRWSMRGTVNYRGFESYKDPDVFPFGDKTLTEYLGNNQVNFNWNTTGLGYSSEASGKQIFALNRTGALATGYSGENEEDYAAAETIGYEYFAKIGDPNLARVVQYAGLYQIFQDSKVTVAKNSVPSPKYTPNNTELYNELISVIKKINDFSPSDNANLQETEGYQKFSDALTVVKNFDIPKDIEAAARSMLEPRNLNNETNTKYQEFQKNFQMLLKQLQQTESAATSSLNRRNSIAKLHDNTCVNRPLTKAEYNKCLAYRNQVYRLEADVKKFENKFILLQYQILTLASNFGIFIEFNRALKEVFDFLSRSNSFINPAEVNRLRELYLKSLPTRNSSWIHTPSIVISNSNNSGSVSGHNLDSGITIFRSGKVLPGKVQIVQQNGRQVIITSPVDASKVSALVRDVAVISGDAAVLKQFLEQKLAAQKPVLPVAKKERLKLSAQNMVNASNRIGNFSPRMENQGWFSTRKADSLNDDIIRITKRSDGAETITYRNAEAFANSPVSRNDYLTNLKFEAAVPVKIKMDGFNEGEADALIKSAGIIYPVHQKAGLIQRINSYGGKYLASDYNLAQAKIGVPKIEGLRRNGADVTRVSVDVEMLRVSANNSKLYFRATSYFKGSISKVKERQVIQKFQTLLNTKFRVAKYSPETDAEQIASEIKREIEAAFPDGFDAGIYYYDGTVSENLNFVINENTNAE